MSGDQKTPTPSKVTADMFDVKEAQVAVIEREGLRLGTSADAGRTCVTARSPGGVSGDMYTYYKRTQGAPGPYLVRNPITGNKEPARDEQGRELFDLDAVKAWNETRPGSGRWNAARAGRGRPVRPSAMRLELMAAAQAGQLMRRRDGRPWLSERELNPREVQRVTELTDAGLLLAPRAQHARYSLSAAGRAWLTQHAPATAGTG